MSSSLAAEGWTTESCSDARAARGKSLLARHEQCCAREVELTFVSADQRAQCSPRLGRVRQLDRPAR